MQNVSWKIIALIITSSFFGGASATWLLTGSPAHAQYKETTRPQLAYQRVVHTTYSESAAQFQKECDQMSHEGWELIQVNESAGYPSKIITYWRRTAERSQY